MFRPAQATSSWGPDGVTDGAHTTHDRVQRTISAGDPGLINSREGYRGVAKSPDARIKISFVRRSSWFSRSKILS